MTRPTAASIGKAILPRVQQRSSFVSVTGPDRDRLRWQSQETFHSSRNRYRGLTVPNAEGHYTHMRHIISLFQAPSAAPLLLGLVAVILTGCSSPKPKEAVTHQRGWIGGQYQEVRRFPPGLKHPPKAALLVTALGTNTPARLAGLGEGDLILELNHQPATRLRGFYRTIDGSEPGTLLPVKTWHDGQTVECQVPVGRETYDLHVSFGAELFFPALWLWPDSGFSLAVLGYEPESLDSRMDLASAREKFLKSCDQKNYRAAEDGWSAWLAILRVGTQKLIHSQENMSPRAPSRPPVGAPPR